MGGFFGGILQGLSSGLQKTQEQIRQEEAQRDADEHDVLLSMLKSDSAPAQRYALAELLQGRQGKKGKTRTGGLRGWLGETEKTPHYQQLTDLERSLQGAPQAAQVQEQPAETQVDREVGTAPPRLVGAPEAPQFQTAPGAPVPEPFRFEGQVVNPADPDETVLGPQPTMPTGYINIPREVSAKYTQDVTAHNARRTRLQAERDAYRKELAGAATRKGEETEKRAYQERRDVERESFQLELNRISNDRQDARQNRTDARIERQAKEARGETTKRDATRAYHQDRRHEEGLYEREKATLTRMMAPPEEIAAARVQHEAALQTIEKEYGAELRQAGGAAHPGGKPRYNMATGKIEYQ